MRAVTRVATPNNEEQLLTIALGGTAGQVERMVRAWRKVDRIAEEEQVDYQQKHASMTTYTDEDRMLVIRGRLPSEIGAVFVKALQAASDKLYQDDNELPPERRRAEAIQVIAEAALNAELDPGTSADRYQVVIHVDEPVLADSESEGQSVLEGGIGVSAETSRRLACDSSIVVMTHDAEGNVLDVGRKTRKISPALRRALDFRSVKLQLVSGRGAIARLCKHVTSNPGWMTEKRSSQISPIYAIGIIIEFMMMASASSFRQTAKRGCFILTAGRSSKSLRHRSCRTNHSPSSSSKVGKATRSGATNASI